MALEDMIPPAERNFVGSGDFLAIGNEFFRYFVERGGLKPSGRVLDVGCGIGRMAVPLTQYLDPTGGYEGIDIVQSGIDWCEEKITPRYPHFRFHLADVYNKHYRPEGKLQSRNYRFPFADASFDFVFLTSVFTHMFTEDMENYLFEIARTMRLGARCLITFFLMNREAASLVHGRKSTLDFRYGMDGCYSADLEVPERAVSHDEAFVRRLYDQVGLKITDPVGYGNWCGRSEFVSYQDIVTATKVRAVSRHPRQGRFPRLRLFPKRFRPVQNLPERYRVSA